MFWDGGAACEDFIRSTERIEYMNMLYMLTIEELRFIRSFLQVFSSCSISAAIVLKLPGNDA